MSEASSERGTAGDAAGGTRAGAGQNKVMRSLVFVAVLATVLGVFSYLSTLEAPPDLPRDDVHKLRFNNDGELIGLGVGDLPTTAADGTPLAMDKKAIEGRVNTTCVACHGTPQMLIDGTTESHSCRTTPGVCLPEHHPPKETCIKCHRTAKAR